MISKSFTAAAVALVASSTLVSGQTSTKCSPLEKTCPADPAIGNNKVSCDFASACDAFNLADGTTLTYGSNGAVFTINTETDAPTITTGKYIFFGRLDIEIQAAPGDGIVTSAVLQSDDLDEIDWEWVGGDNSHAQSNYFSKGQTETYDRGAYHAVSNPTGSFHTYSVEWTPTAIQWIIDGATVRTLEAANAHGVDGFPQTPMQVKLGTWVAGRKDAPEGTVTWAGGLTDFSQKPFLGYYKSISIVDYAGQSGPTSQSVKEYIYGDHSGNADSIQVVGGSGSASSSSASSSAASKTASKTSAAPTTTTTKAASKTTEASSTTTTSEKKTETTTTKAASKTTEAASSTDEASSTAAPATTLATASSSSTTTAPATTTPATKPSSGAVANGVTFGAGALAAFMMVAQLF